VKLGSLFCSTLEHVGRVVLIYFRRIFDASLKSA
jgi:hypothetical protein